MSKKATLILTVVLLSAALLCAGNAVGKGKSRDHGRKPWVVNIEELTLKNDKYRATHWTGEDLQMTTMSIEPGGEIGLERHDDGDQFIRVEEGACRVVMGKSRERMTFDKTIKADWAIFIPSGYWHNIINEGKSPLKIYAIYAPPAHPAGTMHRSFGEAHASEHH